MDIIQKVEYTRRLVESAVSGDKGAFVSLIDCHRRTMYATALAVTKNEEDALDAIQETILILWEKLPSLRSPRYFKTWMTKILVNSCCSLLRKSRRELPMDELPQQGEEPDRDTPLDVSSALSRLGANDSLILQLFYFEDMTIKQIAEALSLTPAAVKMRLSRSRQRFLQQYNTEVRYEQKESKTKEAAGAEPALSPAVPPGKPGL